MESFPGDIDESTEDTPGRKKSKLKSLKTRLFGRNKRAGGERDAKLSQSASDITAGKGLGSDEDLVCSQGTMGSRALSHDSIFLADQVLTDTEPARILSQENVHSKIKALQMKLQQQKMHLGPPPLVLPIRRPEDLGCRSEDDSLLHSPREVSGSDVTSQGPLSKTLSQPSSRPLSPIPKPAVTKYVPQTPSHPLPPSAPFNSSVTEPPLDFSSPAQFTPCLDTSAARHRMSVKPRNQRASTKKRLAATDSRSHLHTPNNIDHPESVKEEKQWLGAQEKMTLETERGDAVNPVTAQRLPSKSPEMAPTTSETAPKSFSSPFSQQDHAPTGRGPPQVLRVKPHRPVDVMSSEWPRSSFIESEHKNKREMDFEIQIMSHDKRNTLKNVGTTEENSDQLLTSFGSVLAPRPSSVHQQVQAEIESTRGIKRPAPGPGSSHFSITTATNRDGERPRSGSFAGMLEQAETRHKTMGRTEDKPFSSLKEKGELRDLQPRGGPFAVGRLKQEGAPAKISVLPWDRRDSLKKTESVTASKNTATDAGTVGGEEVDITQEEVEEAVEAQEVQVEEGKTAFGIKLRSTSHSIRFRSDATSNHLSKPLVCEDQYEKQKRQQINDNVGHMPKKLPTNLTFTPSTSGEVREKDPTPSGLSLPVKNNLPSTSKHDIMSAEVQVTSVDPKEGESAHTVPQEPQPVPQTASSEVSWMSLAMEKTRSLQQLFTSRFPRDFTSMQTVARPQPQVQPMNPAETQTGAQMQTIKMQHSTTPVQAANQLSADTVKAATEQSRSQTQTVKPPLMSEQQQMSTTSTVLSHTSREQMSKQTYESQPHPHTTQSASQCLSHPPAQTNPWTSQSPLRLSTQTETSSQFAQGNAPQCLVQSHLSSGQHAVPQQPCWSNRGLHPTNQLKPTVPVSSTPSATAPPPASALGTEEREDNVQETEGPSLSGRRAVWAGSVSGKEKRAEWTIPAGTKGVELKKVNSEVQTSTESPAPAKMIKDTKPEGKQGVKLAESSPTKVPDRPREEKWLRKNMAPSSPSSSPTQPSVLQSISDSGQPSWMELAKRKSMAWSDKTMD